MPLNFLCFNIMLKVQENRIKIFLLAILDAAIFWEMWIILKVALLKVPLIPEPRDHDQSYFFDRFYNKCNLWPNFFWGHFSLKEVLVASFMRPLGIWKCSELIWSDKKCSSDQIIEKIVRIFGVFPIFFKMKFKNNVISHFGPPGFFLS
jgi:hypothetical protein